jgi:hypothetical protein
MSYKQIEFDYYEELKKSSSELIDLINTKVNFTCACVCLLNMKAKQVTPVSCSKCFSKFEKANEHLIKENLSSVIHLKTYTRIKACNNSDENVIIPVKNLNKEEIPVIILGCVPGNTFTHEKYETLKPALFSFGATMNNLEMNRKVVDTLLRIQKSGLGVHRVIGFSSHETTVMTEVSKIIYCKAMDNYTEVYMVDKPPVLVSKTLMTVEKQLEPYGDFVRIHRSYLVNRYYIMELKQHKLVLENGISLAVATRRRTAVKHKLETI